MFHGGCSLVFHERQQSVVVDLRLFVERINGISTFGRYHPIVVLEGATLGGGLAHTQNFSVFLYRFRYQAFKLRAVMMLVVIRQNDFHSIILEHLKEFFHNFFECSAEGFNASLLVLVSEQSFAESEIHCRKVGYIIYVSSFALNYSRAYLARHFKVANNIRSHIFHIKANIGISLGGLSVSVSLACYINIFFGRFTVAEKHIFGKERQLAGFKPPLGYECIF